MSKWINSKINEFMGTDFTIRESELATMFSAILALVSLTFVM